MNWGKGRGRREGREEGAKSKKKNGLDNACRGRKNEEI